MDTNLDKERAKERKGEILHTFERMIMYAVQNDISSILIAGDMFDVKNISATARNVVLYNIVGHPEITFYYLRGNHDYLLHPHPNHHRKLRFRQIRQDRKPPLIHPPFKPPPIPQNIHARDNPVKFRHILISAVRQGLDKKSAIPRGF